MSAERQQAILSALSAELARQAGVGGAALKLSGIASDRLVGIDGKVDVLALATAIDAALGGDTLDAGPPTDADEGLTPDELDASNDE